MHTVALFSLALLLQVHSSTLAGPTCTLSPLGPGEDDTDQVESAIKQCGNLGQTTFTAGDYNITRKMTWKLSNSRVDIEGFLNFAPNIQYWLQSNSTYRVVYIQNQASWFVVTGNDFTIDAHGKGGINGNGQAWWSYFANRTRLDGDGRPISFTLKNVTNSTVRDFRIEAPPFWANTVADSVNVTYDGMYSNATNQDPLWKGQNIVPNTDGINIYRSDRVTLLNWDITSGDDALAIKGNSTNVAAKGIVVRGGNGIAFGSLGQYQNLSDIVENVTMEDVQLLRLEPDVQPNLKNGVYFKSWTGTANGSPPTGGGGGSGRARYITLKNFTLDDVDIPTHLYQTNNGHSADIPSSLQFSNISFIDWKGTATSNKIVDIECSVNAPCGGISFSSWNVSGPSGSSPRYICSNTLDVTGISNCS